MTVLSPSCPLGYPASQLRDVLGDVQFAQFREWLAGDGQTLSECTGMVYDRTSDDYVPGCTPSHGMVIHATDFQRWLRGFYDGGA